jgi:probable DNA metabolism protein
MLSLQAMIQEETLRLSAMSDMQQQQSTYVYDGSFEGMLTGIFQAFARHETPLSIVCEEHLQLSVFDECLVLSTDEEQAFRVRRSISLRFGEEAYEAIRRVFLSDDPEKDIIIYRYLSLLYKQGRAQITNLSHPVIAAFNKIDNYVLKETQYHRQFIRFAKMPNNVYVARISPRACVVPLLMDYFATRFNTQPFLIYDETHHMAGIFDMKDWRLVRGEELILPKEESDEVAYQQMWKRFYDAICNRERFNPGLRRQLMPKRFWGHLSEMNPLL